MFIGGMDKIYTLISQYVSERENLWTSTVAAIKI